MRYDIKCLAKIYVDNDMPIIIIINIIIDKVLIKMKLNKVIAGALYIVICG